MGCKSGSWGLRVALVLPQLGGTSIPPFSKPSCICTHPPPPIPPVQRRISSLVKVSTSSWVPHSELRIRERREVVKKALALGTGGTRFQFPSCHPLAKPMVPHLQSGGDNACFVPLLSLPQGLHEIIQGKVLTKLKSLQSIRRW